MEIWQLVLAVLVVVIAFATLLVKLTAAMNANIKAVDEKYQQETKDLHARHNNLKDDHNDHVKEVANAYAKRSDINDGMERIEKLFSSRLNLLESLLNQLLNKGNK